MFIGRLSAAAQDAFLHLALRLIAADGQETAAEAAAFQALRAEAGALPPDWTPADRTEADLLAALPSPAARRMVLLELLGLAHADLRYADREQDMIEGLAGAMGVSSARLAVLESWVIRQLALSAEAERLLREEG